MEQALAAPQTLLDLLWEHERDAAPLATPEDKAGLKARLNAHVETIADADIKALYRRELMDRFSAFAFPRREERPWQPAPRFAGKPFPARPTPQNAGRLRKATSGGARDGLAAAVLAGMIRFPDEARRHADAILAAHLPDPRFDALIEAVECDASLESARLVTILAERGLAAPTPEEYADLRFGFLAESLPAEQARPELAQAIGLLVERPALEAALAAATARFEQDLSEGAYAEQQRLLKRKLEFDSRLRQMASARSSAPGGAG